MVTSTHADVACLFLDRKITGPLPAIVGSQAGHATGSPQQPTDHRYRRRPRPRSISCGPSPGFVQSRYVAVEEVV